MSDDQRPTWLRDLGPGDESERLPPDVEFDAWIDRIAPSVHVPPSTPRAEMWDVIAARAAVGRATPPTANSPTAISVWRSRWARPAWAWPAAIAAALLVGIGIDRVAIGREALTPPATQFAHSADTAATDAGKLYRLAAVETLGQAEALLTAYRADGAMSRDSASSRQLGLWGRQLLSSTRLLLDSPAGDDPQFRRLLDDLELVLVQIIRGAGAELDASERALIEHAMKERNLLPRIRTVVPAGGAAADTD